MCTTLVARVAGAGGVSVWGGVDCSASYAGRKTPRAILAQQPPGVVHLGAERPCRLYHYYRVGPVYSSDSNRVAFAENDGLLLRIAVLR